MVRYLYQSLFVTATLTLATSCTENGPGMFATVPSYDVTAHTNLKPYKNCLQIQEDLKIAYSTQQVVNWNRSRYWAKKYGGTGYASEPVSDSAGAPMATPSAATSKNEVGTNLQESGIDESDSIKMDANNIYISNNQPNLPNSEIAIIRKNPLKNLGKISLADKNATQLYAIDKLLVTSSQTFTKEGAVALSIQTYDTDSEEMPKLVNETKLAGTYVDSRLIGRKMIVVFRDNLWVDYSQDNSPTNSRKDVRNKIRRAKMDKLYRFKGDKLQGIECTRYYQPVNPKAINNEITHVVTLDLDSHKILSEATFLNPAELVYMSSKNIYISAKPLREPTWVSPDNGKAQVREMEMMAEINEKLVVTKVSFDNESGALKAQATGIVDGYVKPFGGQWAFKEIEKGGEDYLSVVTTTGNVRPDSEKDIAQNHLYTLIQDKKELKVAGALHDFGTKEDVRAVRYMGDIAYVVTFQRTDPLFAIDLSAPKDPKIIGELKIPGFSMYMHPVSDGRMLGVGFDTEASGEDDRSFYQGLLVQLFDVNDATNMTRLDFKTLGKRGSYSEANQDHHAFYFDPIDQILGYPAVLFDDGSQVSGPNGQKTNNRRDFSGAVFYKVQNDSLVELVRESHFDYLPTTCQRNFFPQLWSNPVTSPADVRRVFKSDGRVYVVSNFGVSILDAESMAKLEGIRIPFEDCPPAVIGGGFE